MSTIPSNELGGQLGQLVEADEHRSDFGRVIDGRRDESAEQIEVPIGGRAVDQRAKAASCRSLRGKVATQLPPTVGLIRRLPSPTCTRARSSSRNPTSRRSSWPTSGFTQTFAELDAAANQLSRLLRSVGVQPGDHVAICMENHDRYFESRVGLPLRGRGVHGLLEPADER